MHDEIAREDFVKYFSSHSMLFWGIISECYLIKMIVAPESLSLRRADALRFQFVWVLLSNAMHGSILICKTISFIFLYLSVLSTLDMRFKLFYQAKYVFEYSFKRIHGELTQNINDWFDESIGKIIKTRNIKHKKVFEFVASVFEIDAIH